MKCGDGPWGERRTYPVGLRCEMASTQTPSEPRRKPCNTTADQPRLATANGRPRSTSRRRVDDAPRGRGTKQPSRKSVFAADTRQRREGGRTVLRPRAGGRTMTIGTARWRSEMRRQPRRIRPTRRAATPELRAETTDERRQRAGRQSAGPLSGGAETRGAWPNDTKFSGERSESAATRC